MLTMMFEYDNHDWNNSCKYILIWNHKYEYMAKKLGYITGTHNGHVACFMVGWNAVSLHDTSIPFCIIWHFHSGESMMCALGCDTV